MNATNEPRGGTQEERDYYALSGRVYAIFAHVYDAVVSPFKRLRREVASMVDPSPGAWLLEVATGTAAQALAFAEKTREVVGIDLSEAMLRVARRKNRFPEREVPASRRGGLAVRRRELRRVMRVLRSP